MIARVTVRACTMRKALLLYNPLSGRRRDCAGDVQAAAGALKARGVEVSCASTEGPGLAIEQVRQAIQDGYDTVFACGGDGTIHEVAQGLVGSEVALGIIPLGTANSLASDLALPSSPVAAATLAFEASPRRIAVGRVEFRRVDEGTSSRFFLVTAGIGVDAHLFYKLNPRAKRRLGVAAYYVKALHLWLTHKMEPFEVAVSPDRRGPVSQLLAVRIRNFGGALRELAPGASIEREDLRLVLFHTRSRAAYFSYVLRGLLGARWKIPGIELLHTTEVKCQAPQSSRIFVEADGELLGMLPAQISVVPDALTILAPANR